MSLLTHQPRKRFGQHFLHDNYIIQKIIQAATAANVTRLTEIGAGRGALTIPLLQQGIQLNVVELDRDLVEFLQTEVKPLGDLTIYAADALKFDFAQLDTEERRLNIVGNLPYNISTPLLFHLLTYAQRIECMTFMLQKEVVDRIVAAPDSEFYGRLSVMLQYYCAVEALFDVGAGAFTPPPKVESSVVQLFPYQHKPHIAHNELHFAQLVASAFSQRRKTLKNNLKAFINAEQITQLQLDPQSRAETLGVAEFVALANYYTTLNT